VILDVILGLDNLSEDVGGRGFSAADHMGGHTERYGRVCVSESRSNDMNRHPGQQESRGMQVP
jgi:hypothetical protein